MTEEKTEKTVKPKQEKKEKDLLAVILIRTTIGLTYDMKETLNFLRLRRKYTCVVVEKVPEKLGMLNKVKDFVTYGEISKETLKELIDKRGQEDPNNKGKLKSHFHLHPPRGGFERKGTKKPFTKGGVLGYRKEKINDLLKRML
ncbi:MAG: uL30 family ribosomal protein [Nanoarchaeota archaeon]|nr:uL30 family ribosomal protein [Nanoarchaeota archaeon]MBU1030528.1 uL30 family ribosomal protein [Nanoarchaeota archaeon]MBU1849494.1 uL30 family ribosomal protein [Nanoarchaeota archaeon]